MCKLTAESFLTVDDVLEMGCDHVAIATGAKWRTDFTGLQHQYPVEIIDPEMIMSPDQVILGSRPKGKVMIYDDDHYYLASAIAEQLASEGTQVVFVTPSADIAEWTHNTLENEHIQVRLRELGVEIICNKQVLSVGNGEIVLGCVYMETSTVITADKIIPVTARNAQDELYQELILAKEKWVDSGIKTVTPIGDCFYPCNHCYGGACRS